jgi:glycerol-3-phosphate cytidylyltransferase
MNKKILVDMSCTILHHGHVRLLKRAAKYGKVIVALTIDKEVKKHKGYQPEIKYKFRKEILESIKYVYRVIPSNWKISEKFIKKEKIDIFIRGSDYKKEKFSIKTIIFPRTKNISSSKIRKKSKNL